MDDDGYDVREVEARLARMEAKRRMHAEGAGKAQSQPQLVSHRCMESNNTSKKNVSKMAQDFDLSPMDASSSSESESESESDCDDHGHDLGKRKLMDSLDLSMSMAVVEQLPTLDISQNKQAGQQSTTKRGPLPTRTAMGTELKRQIPLADSSSVTATTAAVADDLFAGRLVQRRRELERAQATQQEMNIGTAKQEHGSGNTNRAATTPASTQQALHPVEAAGVSQVKPSASASRIPKPTHVQPDHHHHRQQQAKTDVSPPPATTHHIATNHALASTQQISKATPTSQPPLMPPTTTSKPADELIRRATSVTTTIKQPPPIVQETTATQCVRTTTNDKPPKLDVAPTVGPTRKPVVVAAPATAAVTAVLIPVNKTGYARVLPPKEVPPKEPETPQVDNEEDNFMDELLSAEELRLRESLDQLSSRLTTLTTRKATAAVVHHKPPLGNQHELLADDSKPPAAAMTTTHSTSAYGGGTHVRAHQPTSPTTRASHAKRSELSSGVHKPRVRPGPTQEQNATITTASAPEGKHKVVIKRDLAHLLF